MSDPTTGPSSRWKNAADLRDQSCVKTAAQKHQDRELFNSVAAIEAFADHFGRRTSSLWVHRLPPRAGVLDGPTGNSRALNRHPNRGALDKACYSMVEKTVGSLVEEARRILVD